MGLDGSARLSTALTLDGALSGGGHERGQVVQRPGAVGRPARHRDGQARGHDLLSLALRGREREAESEAFTEQSAIAQSTRGNK